MLLGNQRVKACDNRNTTKYYIEFTFGLSLRTSQNLLLNPVLTGK